VNVEDPLPEALDRRVRHPVEGKGGSREQQTACGRSENDVLVIP
jgi:hypothetical protein